MHINIDTDILFVASALAHFDSAGRLIGYMCDTAASDDLAKSIKALRHRVAELLARSYGLLPSEEPDSSRASVESTKGEEPEAEESDFADMLYYMRDSAARATAFTNAAKGLANELATSEDCNKCQLADLVHLAGAISEALLEVTDLVRVFGQRLSKQGSAS